MQRLWSLEWDKDYSEFFVWKQLFCLRIWRDEAKINKPDEKNLIDIAFHLSLVEEFSGNNVVPVLWCAALYVYDVDFFICAK